MWSADLFVVDLIKEYKLGGCQRRKLVFVVTGWFMPYFHLLPFVINEEYGEGEISRVVIFVSVLSLLRIFFSTYSLSSVILLSIINDIFLRRLASFRLP